MFGMFGGSIMSLITKQLASPGTQKMIAEKLDEMYAHLANEHNCQKEDVSLMLKLEKLPVHDEKGNIRMDENGEVVKENRGIIYVIVKGNPVTKIAVDQFLALMTPAE